MWKRGSSQTDGGNKNKGNAADRIMADSNKMYNAIVSS